MKILILTGYFFPEEFLINDLAQEWVRQGHQVEVLAQVPSYPHDRIFPGYQNRFYQTTREFHDIPVHRVKTRLGYNQSFLRKIWNYISFAFLTCGWALFNGWRYDRIYTYQIGPLTVGAAALFFHFLWWKKCVIWTQDLWPDTVYSYGVKKTKIREAFLAVLVRFLYWPYSVITISCPGFAERLKHYTNRKVVFTPQWTTQNKPLPPRKEANQRIFTFAGNIGSVQNLDRMVEVFGHEKIENAVLQIVGDGIFLEKLQNIIADKHLTNILLPGRRPQSEMPKLFADSDVLIISLKSEFNMTIPAKFQAYIAAGRPILCIASGDIADLIKKYDLGMVANPDDDSSIADTFRKMANCPISDFARWRKNALTLSNDKFKREYIIAEISRLLMDK